MRLSRKFQLNTSDMYRTAKNTKTTKGKHIILRLPLRVLRALHGNNCIAQIIFVFHRALTIEERKCYLGSQNKEN